MIAGSGQACRADEPGSLHFGHVRVLISRAFARFDDRAKERIDLVAQDRRVNFRSGPDT